MDLTAISGFDDTGFLWTSSWPNSNLNCSKYNGCHQIAASNMICVCKSNPALYWHSNNPALPVLRERYNATCLRPRCLNQASVVRTPSYDIDRTSKQQ
jgi:hypothetical protein